MASTVEEEALDGGPAEGSGLWVKWRGKWQPAICASPKDASVAIVQAKPAYSGKLYILVYFPNTDNFVWADSTHVWPIEESPEPVACSSHLIGREMVADRTLPRKQRLANLAKDILDIANQLSTKSIVQVARSVSVWKKFASDTTTATTYNSLCGLLLQLSMMLLEDAFSADWVRIRYDGWKLDCMQADTAVTVERLTKELAKALKWENMHGQAETRPGHGMDQSWDNSKGGPSMFDRHRRSRGIDMMVPCLIEPLAAVQAPMNGCVEGRGVSMSGKSGDNNGSMEEAGMGGYQLDSMLGDVARRMDGNGVVGGRSENFRVPMGVVENRSRRVSASGFGREESFTYALAGGGSLGSSGREFNNGGGKERGGAVRLDGGLFERESRGEVGNDLRGGFEGMQGSRRAKLAVRRSCIPTAQSQPLWSDWAGGHVLHGPWSSGYGADLAFNEEDGMVQGIQPSDEALQEQIRMGALAAGILPPVVHPSGSGVSLPAGVDAAYSSMGFGIANGGYGGGEQTTGLGMAWLLEQHVDRSRMTVVPGGNGMTPLGGHEQEETVFSNLGVGAKTNNNKETIDLTHALSNVDVNGTAPDLMMAASRDGWLDSSPLPVMSGNCEYERFSSNVGPLEQELRQGIGLSCRWSMGNDTGIIEGDFVGCSDVVGGTNPGSIRRQTDGHLDMGGVGTNLEAFSKPYREEGADIVQTSLDLSIPERSSRRTAVVTQTNSGCCEAGETVDDVLRVGNVVRSATHSEVSKRASISAQVVMESSDVMNMSVCQAGSGKDMEEVHGESRDSRSPERMAFLDCLLAKDGAGHQRALTGSEKGDVAHASTPGSGKHGTTHASGTKSSGQKKSTAPICEGITALGRRCSHRAKPGTQFCEKHKQGNKGKEESGLILIANAIATVAENISTGGDGLDSRGKASVALDLAERNNVSIALDSEERTGRANGSVDPAARALIMASTGAANLDEEADADSGAEHVMSGAIVVYGGKPEDTNDPDAGPLGSSQPGSLSEARVETDGDQELLEEAVAGLERLEGPTAPVQTDAGEDDTVVSEVKQVADSCQGMTLLGRPCKHRAKPGLRYCEKHKGTLEEKGTSQVQEAENDMANVQHDVLSDTDSGKAAVQSDGIREENDEKYPKGGDEVAAEISEPVAIEDASKEGEHANEDEAGWALTIVPLETENLEKDQPVLSETEKRKKHRPPQEGGKNGRVEGEPARKVEVCRGITMAGVACKQRVRQGTTYCDWHVGQAVNEEEGSSKVLVVSRRQENEKGGKGVMVEKLCEGTTLLGKQCTHRAKPLSRFCEKHNPPSQKNEGTGEQEENNCSSAADHEVLDTMKSGRALIQAPECASREVVAVEQPARWKDLDPQFCSGITLFGSQCSHRPRPGSSYCVKHNPDSLKKLLEPVTKGTEWALVCVPAEEGVVLSQAIGEEEKGGQLNVEGGTACTESTRELQQQRQEEEDGVIVRTEVEKKDAVPGETIRIMEAADNKIVGENQDNDVYVDAHALAVQRKRKAPDDSVDGHENERGSKEVSISRQDEGNGDCGRETELKKWEENRPLVCVGITKENRRCTHHAMRKKLYCRKHLKKVKRMRTNCALVTQPSTTAEETAATLMEMTKGSESPRDKTAEENVILTNGKAPPEADHEVCDKKRKAGELAEELLDSTVEPGRHDIEDKASEIFAGFMKAVKQGPKDGPALIPGPTGDGHRMVFESNLLDGTFALAEKKFEVCEELLVLVAEEQTKMLKVFERTYGKEWVQSILKQSGESDHEWQGDSPSEVNEEEVVDGGEEHAEREKSPGEVLLCKKVGPSILHAASKTIENGDESSLQQKDGCPQKLVGYDGPAPRCEELAALADAAEKRSVSDAAQAGGEVAPPVSTAQQKKRRKRNRGSSGRGGSGGDNQNRKKLRCRRCGAEFEVLYEMLLHWRANHMLEAQQGGGGKKSKKGKKEKRAKEASSGAVVNPNVDAAQPTVIEGEVIGMEAEVDNGMEGSSMMAEKVEAREPSGGPCAEIEDTGRNDISPEAVSPSSTANVESRQVDKAQKEGVKNDDTGREETVWRYTCRECGMKFDLLPDLGRHFKAKHIDRQVPPAERRKRDRKRKRFRASGMEGKSGSKQKDGVASGVTISALASGSVRPEGARKRKPTWKVLESDHTPDGILEAVVDATDSEELSAEDAKGAADGYTVVQEVIAEQLVKLSGWPDDAGRGEETAAVESLLRVQEAAGNIEKDAGSVALRPSDEMDDMVMVNGRSDACGLIEALEDGDDKQLEQLPARKRLKDMARSKPAIASPGKEGGSGQGGKAVAEGEDKGESVCTDGDDLLVEGKVMDSLGKIDSASAVTASGVKVSMRKLARCRGDSNGGPGIDIPNWKLERENGVVEVSCPEPVPLRRVSPIELAEIAKDSCCKWAMFEVLMERQGKVPDKIAVKANRTCCEKGWTIYWYKRGYRCPNGCKAAYLKKHRPKNGLMPSGEKAVNREPDKDEDDMVLNGNENVEDGCPILEFRAANGACALREVAITHVRSEGTETTRVPRNEGEGKAAVEMNEGREKWPLGIRKEPVRRRVICPDMSFGLETLSIPCIIDETDDDDGFSGILGEADCHVHGNGAGAQPGVSIPTSVEIERRPWESFTYATKRRLDPALGVDTVNSQVACTCSGARCSAALCEHVRLFNQDNIEACDIDGELMLDKFPYDERGCIVLQEKYMVYECSPMCMCSDNCQNRVLQKGVRVKLEVYRTKHKGWAVRAAEAIPRGTFVCEYIGEVVDDREANRRGERYDQVGCSYLYDIDVHLDPPAFRNRARPFVIDATKYGNVSRFINHSCQPNLVNYQVLVESMDVRLAHVGLYANCDIQAGEELAYDYRYKLLPGKGCPCYCGAPKCRGRLY